MHVVEAQELTGVITLKPGMNTFTDCWAAPGKPPVIDFGGEGQSLDLLAFSGGVELQNKTGTETARIDLLAGRVTLAESMKNGTVIVRGCCPEDGFTNFGSCVVDDQTVDPGASAIL